MTTIRDHTLQLTVGLLSIVILYAWFARPPISWTIGLATVAMLLCAALVDHRFVVKRLVGAVPTMLAVSLFVFTLLDSLPGDPAIALLGPTATNDAVAELTAELGLDEPFFSRFGGWLGDIAVGDLGRSVPRGGEPVADGVSQAITPTLQLMLYSLVLALAVAIPLALLAAHRRGSRTDGAANAVMLGFLATPSFVVAVILVLFLAVGGVNVRGVDIGWKVLPAIRYVPFGEDWVLHFKHLVLPAVSLAMGQAAIFMRLLRSELIENLKLPFIDLARSKGLATWRILAVHALRPSSAGLFTVAGLTIGSLIGGALVIETIFAVPGIGSYIFTAVSQRDYVAVQGAVFVVSGLFLLLLNMSDLLHLALDPRLRGVTR